MIARVSGPGPPSTSPTGKAREEGMAPWWMEAYRAETRGAGAGSPLSGGRGDVATEKYQTLWKPTAALEPHAVHLFGSDKHEHKGKCTQAPCENFQPVMTINMERGPQGRNTRPQERTEHRST